MNTVNAVDIEKPAFGKRDPDARGYFGDYGGRFVPETLVAPIEELTQGYLAARADASFGEELSGLLHHYVGRPTPLYETRRLAREARGPAKEGPARAGHYGASDESGIRIILKREDPTHTGALFQLGYLNDLIYTLDAWMHRVDITRTTGRAMVLDAEHDGRLLADIVAEWARRHGRPVTLELTGPAGASYAQGADGEVIRMDAVEFARTVSLRTEGTGLLAHAVPF